MLKTILQGMLTIYEVQVEGKEHVIIDGDEWVWYCEMEDIKEEWDYIRRNFTTAAIRKLTFASWADDEPTPVVESVCELTD